MAGETGSGTALSGSSILKLGSNLVRALAASAALTAAVMLSGCQTDGVPGSTRANAPIPPALLAEMSQKNMSKESPLLIRIFKQEAELEVWKKDNTGRFALLKTYPICKWSGDLGPKVREGDRQAPEGFYTITPGQMNPNSQYYLAFNMGFPNAYDRAHDRTGAHLMVHGDCSSRGCYAMTDEQISEIFAMGREAFFGGQRSFQVQAYPFRMTPVNMVKHRNNPNMPFWKMLKEGYDHFEVTHLEPKVDVCEKRYVFNAGTPDNATPFNAKGKCPAYEVPQDIALAVQDKQRRDELQFAEMAARGTPTAPIRSGQDGGMHPTFIAKLQPREIVDQNGNAKLVVERSENGAIVAGASPVAAPSGDGGIASLIETGSANRPVEVADVPVPRNAPQGKQGTRPAEPSFAQRLGSLFRGSAQSDTTRVATAEPAAEPQAKPAAKPSLTSRVMSNLRRSETEPPAPKTRPAIPAAKPNAPEAQSANAATKPAAETTASTAPAAAPMAGAAPIPASSNFENRWSAF